jgi:hypothetical protein
VCAAAPHNSTAVHRFDEAYMEIAGYVGINLAPRDDPDKSFGPSKRGTVFGIYYDTANWTWRIPEEKLARLISDINEALAANTTDERTVKPIVGKIIHIKPLVQAGKFHIDTIMKWLANSQKADQVSADGETRRQLTFWITLLRTCSGNTAIPYPFDTLPAWAIIAYTDAAGGSSTNPASGTGGIMGSWWYWYPWAKRIQHGILKHKGKKVGRKLTALELIGPLVVIAANFAECRYRPVTVWVDNSGSIGVWRKGYSNHCSLSTTVAKAINTVATAAGCEIFIKKITRCSTTGAKVADHLSKGEFGAARAQAAAGGVAVETEPARLPMQLLRWLDSPCDDNYLGDRIVAEIATAQHVLRNWL